ncbi:manganese containing catalase [Nitrospirillum amazonense]|uniref:Manganese containing catalase n=1 Tax=Nitrospirillum amazonense TaxID=28077 RepID=A0A560EST4_9PROT|nr:manganese catalase family protein [Nitrospirillum amazonense]TWB12426.1 manganese containing catalase [Nitrospirillum amazonense]
MFMHNKRLQYTVRVAEPNSVLASLMLEQFGGPQGELAAAMRYFTQALGESDPGRKDMLYDIATEELSQWSSNRPPRRSEPPTPRRRR